MPAPSPWIDRLWQKIDKTDGCWLWTGGLTTSGYGILYTSKQDKPRRRLAHRLMYEIEHGPIPDGLFVCHRCDNPPCVNPDHLFLGTASDNMQDMLSKGRQGRAKTCAGGHPWTPESTRYVGLNGRTVRRCRICRREQNGSVAVTATRCLHCEGPLKPKGIGKPPSYCGRPCQLAAYAARKRAA